MIRRLPFAVAAAACLVVGLAAPAVAGDGPATNPNKPAYWEFGGVYSCTKEKLPERLFSYTRPSPVAFVVIRSGSELFVSDLGDANEGDSTYDFDKDIKFVITCEFTDA
jgi:hypothetical protein